MLGGHFGVDIVIHFPDTVHGRQQATHANITLLLQQTIKPMMGACDIPFLSIKACSITAHVRSPVKQRAHVTASLEALGDAIEKRMIALGQPIFGDMLVDLCYVMYAVA